MIIMTLGALCLVRWLATHDSSTVFEGPPPLAQWVGDGDRVSEWRFTDGAVSLTNSDTWIGTDAHMPDRCIVSLTVSQTPHLGGVFISLFTSDPQPRVVYSPDYKMTSHYTIHLEWSAVTLTKIDHHGQEVWLPNIQTEYFYHRTSSRLQILCDRAKGYFALSADGTRLAEWNDTDTPAGGGTGFSIQAWAGDGTFSMRELSVKQWPPTSHATTATPIKTLKPNAGAALSCLLSGRNVEPWNEPDLLELEVTLKPSGRWGLDEYRRLMLVLSAYEVWCQGKPTRETPALIDGAKGASRASPVEALQS